MVVLAQGSSLCLIKHITFHVNFPGASGRSHGLRALAPRASLMFVYGEPAGRVTIVSAALLAVEVANVPLGA